MIVAAQATSSAEQSNRFQMEIAPGLDLDGQIDVINAVGNLWKSLPQKLDISDEGFSGTIVTADGNEIEFEGHFKNTGPKWSCSVKWTGSSETESTFILLSYVMPVDQIQNAEIRSDAKLISFAKMLEDTATLTNLAAVSDFTLGPIDNTTVAFTFGSPMDVQAVRLGDKMSVRILLSPQKEPLPTTGEVAWTLEKL